MEGLMLRNLLFLLIKYLFCCAILPFGQPFEALIVRKDGGFINANPDSRPGVIAHISKAISLRVQVCKPEPARGLQLKGLVF